MAKITMCIQNGNGNAAVYSFNVEETVIVQFEALQLARAYDICDADPVKRYRWQGDIEIIKRNEAAWLCRNGTIPGPTAERILGQAWDIFLAAKNETGLRDAQSILMERPEFLSHNKARDTLTGRLVR